MRTRWPTWSSSSCLPSIAQLFHHQSRHPGAKRTLYFTRLVDLQASKETAKSVVKACETCRLIDLAPVCYKKGKLGVKDNWSKLAMDITHHNGENFLTSTVAPLDLQYGSHCADKMRSLLSDSWTMFSSSEARQWKYWPTTTLHLRFQCTYSPSGNEIVERSHRTIKTIAARKNCSILEAVYWHNITPKDDVSPCTVLANMLHRYHVQIKDVEDNPLPKPEVTRGK